MNLARLMRVLDVTYSPVIEARGGKLDVASDPEHALEILAATAPRGFRVVVLATGNPPAAGDDSPGASDVEFAVVVQGPRGMSAAGGAASVGILEVAAWVDRIVRGFAPFDEAEPPSDFDWFYGMRRTGGEWLEIDGARTRNWQWTYACTVLDDPAAETRPPAGQTTAGTWTDEDDEPVFTPWGETYG